MKRTGMILPVLSLAGLLSVAGCPAPVETDLAVDTPEPTGLVAETPAPAVLNETDDSPAPAVETPVHEDVVAADTPTPAAPPAVEVPAGTPTTPVASPDAVTAFPPGRFAGEMQSRVNVYINNDLVDSIVEFTPFELAFDENGLPVFEDGTELVVGTTTSDQGLTLTVSYVDIGARAIEIDQTGTLADARVSSATYTGTTTLEYLDTYVHYSNTFSLLVEFPDGGIQRQDWFLTCDLDPQP